ncbi:hypothetical protein D9Q98_005041 [Chlorella vulgaris]|uniref:PDZ domain-containing protein n=1 Tax=Chlorella vulgaris TaxID=3077 RepID=A0A9D4TNP4_CHLVU|nr:hypothetical protein D9Q98_005041 [Chlorella vulgaris]
MRQQPPTGGDLHTPLTPGLEVAPPLCSPALQNQEQQQQDEQQQQQDEHPTERWMAASQLSGWKGPGTMLLSLGAVSGAGLLGSGFDVSGPGSVLQALAVLGLTVGIHEAGHFFAAVSRGIHVTKFAIGFGPTIFTYQGKEVEYSLRALPLGGFVAFPDDDPESTYPPDDPNLLRNRSVGDRAAVISAGVIANMILAFTICLVQASTTGINESVYRPGVRLGEIRESTVAGQAGLRRGDVVLKVGDLLVAPRPGAVNDVVNAIKDSPGRELMLEVQRGEERLRIPVTPTPSGSDGSGRIGITLAANAKIVKKKGGDVVATVALAADEFVKLTGTVVGGLYQFITNFSNTVDNVSGPVAILAAGAEVARANTGGLYQFAALININLAVVNILPLPALDGGYLVFIALEALRGGKKINDTVEKSIMAGGFLLLMTAGVSLIVKDTLTLTGLGSLLQ